MATDLLDRRVLRRRTRQGWIDVTEQRADRPEVLHGDTTWPATSIKPPLVAGCWLDGTWPRRGPTPPWWGRSLHDELGTRVVAALLTQNRRWADLRTAA